MHSSGIDFTSLALRFPGDFYKGIDYCGEISDFAKNIKIHGEIARKNGRYKLSLHSGSDKFSIYTVFRKYSKGLFHVKTSGTSWLGALHIIVRYNPELFRKIYLLSLESFEENKKDYHLDLKYDELPKTLKDVKDKKLRSIIYNTNIRQCLHIAYGTVLDKMKKEVYETLNSYEQKHYRFVSSYLLKHLDLLK